MKTQVVVGAAVMMVGTAVAIATAGWGGNIELPTPQAAAAAHRSTGAGPGTHSGAGVGATSLPSGADPPASGATGGTNDPTFSYISSPPAALTGCTVSVSDPAPPRGQTSESATVSTTAGAEVRLEADYVKTRSVHTGIADAAGVAAFGLAISHAQPGHTVPVTATVSLRGAKYSCSTSFTPVYPVGVLPTTGGGV